MSTTHRKSLAAGFAGVLFAMVLSMMFVEATRIELAKLNSSYGHVAAVSALVR